MRRDNYMDKITPAMVEAACRTCYPTWGRWAAKNREAVFRQRMRDALEAAVWSVVIDLLLEEHSAKKEANALPPDPA